MEPRSVCGLYGDAERSDCEGVCSRHHQTHRGHAGGSHPGSFGHRFSINLVVKHTSSCVPATRLPLFERRIETSRLSVPQSHQRQLGKTPTSLARRRCRWLSTICRDNNSRSFCPYRSIGARDTRRLNCRTSMLTRSKPCWPPERGKGRPLPRVWPLPKVKSLKRKRGRRLPAKTKPSKEWRDMSISRASYPFPILNPGRSCNHPPRWA